MRLGETAQTHLVDPAEQKGARTEIRDAEVDSDKIFIAQVAVGVQEGVADAVEGGGESLPRSAGEVVVDAVGSSGAFHDVLEILAGDIGRQLPTVEGLVGLVVRLTVGVARPRRLGAETVSVQDDEFCSRRDADAAGADASLTGADNAGDGKPVFPAASAALAFFVFGVDDGARGGAFSCVGPAFDESAAASEVDPGAGKVAVFKGVLIEVGVKHADGRAFAGDPGFVGGEEALSLGGAVSVSVSVEAVCVDFAACDFVVGDGVLEGDQRNRGERRRLLLLLLRLLLDLLLRGASAVAGVAGVLGGVAARGVRGGDGGGGCEGCASAAACGEGEGGGEGEGDGAGFGVFFPDGVHPGHVSILSPALFPLL